MSFNVPEGPPQLTHLCDMHVDIGPPEVIGQVSEGLRMNFYVTGGWMRGPRLTGKVLPVGGDWITIRNDGVGLTPPGGAGPGQPATSPNAASAHAHAGP